MDQSKVLLLDKIITLYSWSAECLRLMDRLIDSPEKFVETMRQIEECIGRSLEDTPIPEGETGLSNQEHYRLYELAVNSAPVYRLMKTEPFFHQSPPEQIATFAQFADLRPGTGDITLYTRDALFMRILADRERQVPVAAQQLMTQNLTKLIVFDRDYQDVFQCLIKVAQQGSWGVRMLAVEADLEQSTNGAQSKSSKQSEAELTLRSLFSVGQDPHGDATKMREAFLTVPRFSAILEEEVNYYIVVRDQLPEAYSLLDANLFQSLSASDKYSRVAEEALKLMPGELRNSIETSYELRREAADYFLELRKYVKVDALRHKWPDLYRNLKFDNPRLLKTLEGLVIDKSSTTDSIASKYQSLLQDEDGRLARFLGLRPFFRDIYPEDVKKYSDAAQVVSKGPQAQESSGTPTSKSSTTSLTAEAAQPDYENLFVRIEKGDLLQKGEREDYLVMLDRPPDSKVFVQVKIPQEEVERLVLSREELFLARESPGSTQSDETRSVDTSSHLITLGTRLFELIFGDPKLEDYLIQVLSQPRNIRLVIELEDVALMSLPWETLYVPKLRTYPALLTKFSLVRHLYRSISIVPRTFTPPLRILAVMSNPQDAPLLMVDQEMDVLRQTLEGAIQKGQVLLEPLANATREKLQHSLRVFKPHFFHFVGHGTFNQKEGEGALIFEDDQGRVRPIMASEIRTLLVDSNISLAVLNACETGTTGNQKTLTGVAGTLVDNGIPAAVATMRNVLDPAAFTFTREFYRSFVDGYTLEASVIEARKALSIEKWDWTAYALFSRTTKLEAFRLLRTPGGQESI